MIRIILMCKPGFFVRIFNEEKYRRMNYEFTSNSFGDVFRSLLKVKYVDLPKGVLCSYIENRIKASR